MNGQLSQELRGEVDSIFAETVRHLPLHGGRPDPDRSPSEVIVILRTGSRDVSSFNSRSRGARSPGMAAGGGELRINRTDWPELIIRGGDKLVALAREGQPIFEVLTVDDRSHLRLICELGDAR